MFFCTCVPNLRFLDQSPSPISVLMEETKGVRVQRLTGDLCQWHPGVVLGRVFKLVALAESAIVFHCSGKIEVATYQSRPRPVWRNTVPLPPLEWQRGPISLRNMSITIGNCDGFKPGSFSSSCSSCMIVLNNSHAFAADQ